ncbi:MAG: chromate efflux transporter [Chloroflexi bacterium]|nr:chromate efflux transporter [Chloroflexota bacterium]
MPSSPGSRRSPASTTSVAGASSRSGSAVEVFLVALRLGLTSFGGPVAHLGYFRHEYVERRGWLTDAEYADTVALCQALPGPASSQVGIAIGTARAGYLGGVGAWLGFTLPSALALAAFALLLGDFDVSASGWIHGLLIAAVAVVAQAVWGMSRSLAPDPERVALAVAAAAALLMAPSAWMQILVLSAAGAYGWIRWHHLDVAASAVAPVEARYRRLAPLWLALLVLLVLGLNLARVSTATDSLAAMAEVSARAGSLVFGGGHVVLPLLEEGFVPRWLSADEFLAGYGAAQAVPGPLFTFSAYLGAKGAGPVGAVVALAAIFTPSLLLVWGVGPYWDRLRSLRSVRAALRGVNAGVVGLLAAALYSPVITSAIGGVGDAALAILCGALLIVWRRPPWLVVLVATVGGALITL